MQQEHRKSGFDNKKQENEQNQDKNQKKNIYVLQFCSEFLFNLSLDFDFECIMLHLLMFSIQKSNLIILHNFQVLMNIFVVCAGLKTYLTSENKSLFSLY